MRAMSLRSQSYLAMVTGMAMLFSFATLQRTFDLLTSKRPWQDDLIDLRSKLPTSLSAVKIESTTKRVRQASSSVTELKYLPHYYETHIVPERVDVQNVPTSLALAPLFKCHDSQEISSDSISGRAQKLVFVHIFKTAGSTVRVFFDEYARRCNVGWQVTIRCTGVEPFTVKDDNSTWWHKGNDAPCVQKKGVNRDGSPMQGQTSFNGHHLNKEVDILGGHMELGAAAYSWLKHEGLHYIAFFRNATSKYISAKMYGKELLLERALQRHS